MSADFLETDVTASSLDEAVNRALNLFGCSRAEVEIKILQVPSSGFLGLFGRKDARAIVRLTDRAYVARRIAERLLHLSGFEARVEVAPGSQRIELNILSTESNLIIGRHGQTLDALQSLVVTLTDRLVADRTLIIVDIDDYRRKRLESLTKLARRISAQVRHSGLSATLHPLPPEERRILHQVLREESGVESRSIGAGYERKMIISSQGA